MNWHGEATCSPRKREHDAPEWARQTLLPSRGADRPFGWAERPWWLAPYELPPDMNITGCIRGDRIFFSWYVESPMTSQHGMWECDLMTPANEMFAALMVQIRMGV